MRSASRVVLPGLVAGLVWTVLSSLVPARTLLGPMPLSLPAIVLATLAGAWLHEAARVP